MEDMSSSFSSLAIMVLVVNFSNPYKTAGFLSFIKKGDAKMLSTVWWRLMSCLIHAHEDINNLPPFTSWSATIRS